MTIAQPFRTQDLSEALTSVKAQTGILALRDLTSDLRVCLHLSNQRVQAVFVNGRPLRCGDEARRLLLQQFSASSGEIEFAQAPQADLRKGLNICVEGLLADAPEDCGYKAKGFLQKMLRRFARG